MSDFIIAQIRTYVPMIVGAVAAWLAAQGILDADASQEVVTGLTAALTAVAGGIYYFLVRWGAEQFPWLGVLLGVNKAPEYSGE